MRPFYIDKNSFGFYRVRFVDEETGLVSFAKSTHTKNYSDALKLATTWLMNGVPAGIITSRKKQVSIPVPQKILLDAVATQVSTAQSMTQDYGMSIITTLRVFPRCLG